MLSKGNEKFGDCFVCWVSPRGHHRACAPTAGSRHRSPQAATADTTAAALPSNRARHLPAGPWRTAVAARLRGEATPAAAAAPPGGSLG
jgi:hypothetical protein